RLSDPELELARVIAAQVAFAVARTDAQERARRSESRLRFALDAAQMGTWDYDLLAQTVRWSDNLERIHGLPPGTFDGSFGSYEREIHPEDRDRVLASVRRALEQGVPHEVEYRIVAPDGTVRWVEGKGQVEYRDGRPVAMTGVCMNVTRRKEAEMARLDAAHEASRLKDEFLAVLSHELRTPLNAVLGWVYLLQRDKLGPKQIAEALEIITRNARHQAQLIEDIIDVSRIAAGKLELELAPVRIGDVIEDAIDAIRPAALAAHIELQCRIAPGLPPLHGDAKRLAQVLTNLLSNAVKFTPDGGRVEIDCASDGEDVVITVDDSGIGIAPEVLPEIFERFRQADSRPTRRHGGLGLGLAIARHLIEQHGGTIAASSDGAGSGATFTVRLPAASAKEPARRRADAPSGSANGADGPRPAFGDIGKIAGMRVLIVDDDADSRDLLRALLGAAGAATATAAGAADALTVLAQRPFDVLVADVAMPDVDGYELVRRAKSARSNLYAVALTACARPQDRSRAFRAGFDAFESKPLDAARLLATLAAADQRAAG
ncbi:MAG TPA: ATP-binding protein, partial [Burkholderiaceae bacterium]|nr:ATP-binding protein [Burkholderiaceae bacterium]